MEERKKSISHSLYLEERKHGRITGVSDVRSFDEKLIILSVHCGVVTIKGENLHVEQLDLEQGLVELTGKIDSLVYAEEKSLGQRGESLLSRLFQ